MSLQLTSNRELILLLIKTRFRSHTTAIKGARVTERDQPQTVAMWVARCLQRKAAKKKKKKATSIPSHGILIAFSELELK